MTDPSSAGAGRVRDAGSVRLEPAFPPGRVLGGARLDARLELDRARQVLAEARRRSAAVLRAARARAATIGTEAAARARGDLRAEFDSGLRALAAAEDELRRESGPGLRALALRIARAVLDAELRAEPARVLDLCERALRQAWRHRRVALHVHAGDRDCIAGEMARLSARLPFCAELEIVVDPALLRGGVRVETELGSYDGSLDAQLDQLRERVLGGGRR